MSLISCISAWIGIEIIVDFLPTFTYHNHIELVWRFLLLNVLLITLNVSYVVNVNCLWLVLEKSEFLWWIWTVEMNKVKWRKLNYLLSNCYEKTPAHTASDKGAPICLSVLLLSLRIHATYWCIGDWSPVLYIPGGKLNIVYKFNNTISWCCRCWCWLSILKQWLVYEAICKRKTHIPSLLDDHFALVDPS